MEALETRCLLASDWSNPYYVRDVNNDGVVAPVDALVGINELDQRLIIDAEGKLPSRASHPEAFYYDVNEDGFASPIDVLIVINGLNDDDTGPTITVGLAVDTAANGTTNSDLITSDARISGQVLDDLTGVVALKVQVDEGLPTPVTFGRDGVFSFDPGLLPGGANDRAYTLKFTAEDGRQKGGASAFTFTFDTTAPTPPAQVSLAVESDTGTSNSDGITNINKPTFSGDASSGSIITLSANGQIVATTIANSPWTLTSNPLDDGEYDFTVTAQDAAGNASSVVGPVHMTIDTVAPAAPTAIKLTAATDSGSSSADGITNIVNPSATGDAESGTLVRLLVNGQPIGQAGANSPWTIATGNLNDGTFSLTATAEDLAGNVSVASGGFQLVIDTVAPLAPTGLAFTAATDTGRSTSDGVTKNSSPVLSGSTTEAWRAGYHPQWRLPTAKWAP